MAVKGGKERRDRSDRLRIADAFVDQCDLWKENVLAAPAGPSVPPCWPAGVSSVAPAGAPSGFASRLCRFLGLRLSCSDLGTPEFPL